MRSVLLATFLLPVLVLGACTADTPAGNPDDTSPAASDDSPEDDPATAAQAARVALATRLTVNPGDIAVEHAEARDWSDSCLGLGGPAESCLTVITPGYLFLLVHAGAEYRYRTDLAGTVVRAE